MLRRQRDPRRAGGAEEPHAPDPAPAPTEVDVSRLTRDPLTGTVARWLFEDRLTLMAGRLRRSHRLGALLVVDVDGLQVVNETLGRTAGDELLATVAHRIGGRLRDGDTLARLEGDEFAVLVDDLDGRDDAGAVAEQVLAALRSPFRLGHDTAMVSVSIGLVSVDGEEPVDELLRRAELALFRAKRHGGARWAAFEDRTASSVDRRVELEWALRRRLDEGQVRFHHRPVVELGSGRLVLVHSTIATEWPDVGPVSADEVRAVAAATGLAEQLLRVEVATAATAASSRPGEVAVVVPLPAEPLAAGRAVGAVAGAWDRSGGRAGGLVVLVEGDASAAAAVDQLDRLRARGVRVALDLGGPASLEALRAVPADLVVIDGPLLADLSSDRTRAVVGAVLGVAEVLGAGVVATGVDDADLLAAARSLGVDLVQGDGIEPAPEAGARGPRISAATARG